MSNSATRLIAFIMLLQRRPRQKATELAVELGVSSRTIHRYVAMLDEMGIPVYAERGPHGGFSLARGYEMPPLIFTPEEAVAVYLGTSLVEGMWGYLYRDAALGTPAKLDNVLPEEQRYEVAWARRTLPATGMHRTSMDQLTPFLEKLRRAIRERRRVTIIYRTRGQQKPLQRDLDAYALIHRWGFWYVVGHCCLRHALRTFRVDRIAELMLLDQTFETPADFDVQTYLATEPRGQPRVRARLRFSPEAALTAVDDRANWDTMDEQPDGSVVVTFTAPTLEWPVRVALGYGPDVVVLEPDELRLLVIQRTRAVVEMYEETTRRKK